MDLMPKVKEANTLNETVKIEKIKWIFDKNIDDRIIKEANRIYDGNDGNYNISISCGKDDSESYKLFIEKDGAKIIANGAPGAFYALQTLKMLIKQNMGDVSLAKIDDYPDMKYRGFYHDISRGRIPTLDTLKKLADTLAEYKVNSLQLYVEHSFEFKEYSHCRDLGFLTKQEMTEFDAYCKERFIDLVPSLSCFGHLYHLLQSTKYRHLCELSDYEPTTHPFHERMAHHTINPLLSESFELIKSLIDQYIEAFSSDYFNICCDETFDLGNDVNKGKDKGRLYVDFVKKVIQYVESKGKTVMMWGDIILLHPEYISEISDKVIFLNWDYSADPNEKKVIEFEKNNRKQIVCPGTSSWYGFSERIEKSEKNILKFANQGYKHGAVGILNTNWGDLGNLASIKMAEYGMILGAVIGWDKTFSIDESFETSIAEYNYGNSDAVKFLRVFSEIESATHWTNIVSFSELKKVLEKEEFLESMDICLDVLSEILKSDFATEEIKNDFVLSAQGYALSIKWYAKKCGFEIACPIEYEKWVENYRKSWLNTSKKGEIDILQNLFEELECQ